MSGAAYKSDELRAVGDGFPDRGPVCAKCRTRIPQFADLSPPDEARVRGLIRSGSSAEAVKALAVATGCPVRWAKIWVIHEGRPRPASSE